ncbi:alcohol dehydrogenase catalytic domain-containing protein [Nonomuraea sp. NPDC049486]|uniref:zinc-dependent alcohol dehydrogenase n=1 Tax=Nonomuraea sp. NPDC049486 TaxID=3155773 RepID=UPI00341239F8
MEALVYAGPGAVEIRDVPEPEPGPGEVLVEVGHVGVCGTDHLLVRGGLARVRPGVVIGHEMAGRAVGGDLGRAGLRPGDPVAVEPLISCGTCRTCRRGHRHICEALGLYGIDRDGGAASHVVVAADRLHRLPDGVPPRVAALAEPLSVAVHMVSRAGVAVGDVVMIFGGGPIGALLGLVARLSGASAVLVAEPRADRRELLAELGMTVTDPLGADVASWCESRAPGGVDVSFEVSGADSSYAAAAEVTRPRGTVLVGALTDRPARVPMSQVMLKAQTLVGSRVYTGDHMARAVNLMGTAGLPLEALVSDVVPVREAPGRVFGDGPAGLMKTLIAAGDVS